MGEYLDVRGTDPYCIRDFVPEYDAIAAEIVTRSRDVSGRSVVRADIAYGARAREVLDLVMLPNPGRSAPIHVFVHGGYWRSGEKSDYRLVAEPVLAAGGIAALVEYDLMPGQRLPVLVDQVRRAVRWLQEHAPAIGADPARITVSGHSAGAHLACYLAARGPEEVTSPLLPALQGIILLSGIYDLSDIPDSFLRDEAGMTREEAAAWSPLNSAHHSGPNRIVAFGGDETAPFCDQARALHRRLMAEGPTVDLVAVPKANHMNVLLDLADPDGLLGERIVELVSLR